jgi:hypothetical protein
MSDSSAEKVTGNIKPRGSLFGCAFPASFCAASVALTAL